MPEKRVDPNLSGKCTKLAHVTMTPPVGLFLFCFASLHALLYALAIQGGIIEERISVKDHRHLAAWTTFARSVWSRPHRILARVALVFLHICELHVNSPCLFDQCSHQAERQEDFPALAPKLWSNLGNMSHLLHASCYPAWLKTEFH